MGAVFSLKAKKKCEIAKLCLTNTQLRFSRGSKRVKTPACELNLVYSVTSFAARTGVNCALKIFKDKSKSKSKQQLYWCKRRVFKVSGGREVFQITFQVNYMKMATI